MDKRACMAMALLLSVGAGVVAFAQTRERGIVDDVFGGRRAPIVITDNVPYDGKLTFVRLRYTMGFNGGSFRRGEPPWMHDYPTADTHMMKILNELTMVRPRMDSSNILTLSDPELFKYPIAYMSEPGGWMMDEEEVVGLRNYLLKGGFVIFDDFRDQDWDNLEDQMRRSIPDGIWVQLDSTAQIFHSFFEINDLNYLTSYGARQPTYWGLFEGNDRTGRLMAIANRDGDIGEYWEFSDQGYVPVDLSNEAYKFGVNYFIYGLTH
jgi:Domain of unknown function (DUF4159)